jgi:hypothetical protein
MRERFDIRHRTLQCLMNRQFKVPPWDVDGWSLRKHAFPLCEHHSQTHDDIGMLGLAALEAEIRAIDVLCLVIPRQAEMRLRAESNEECTVRGTQSSELRLPDVGVEKRFH